MTAFDRLSDIVGHALARGLRHQKGEKWPYAPSDPAALEHTLQPGDVILISGSERISKTIKYLTQSTW